GQVLADHHGIVVVDRVEPARQHFATLPVGYVVPISGPAMGRIVLSYMDEPEAVRIAREANMIPGSHEDEFVQVLRTIRRNGYATSAGEGYAEFNAVASAVIRGDSDIIAILCVIAYTKDLP